MERKREISDVLALSDLERLLEIPSALDLAKEGLKVRPQTYRDVVFRLAKAYLARVLLDLRDLGDDRYQVEPALDYDWIDAAYWLGHLANLEAGSVLVTTPQGLGRLGRSKEAPLQPDLKQAVLANLGLLRLLPEIYGMARPQDALRKALEDVGEVEKVRQVA